MICILKAIFAWMLLMVISINLISVFIRGFFPAKFPLSGLAVDGIIQSEVNRLRMADHAMTLLAFVAICTYLFAMFYFWNIGLAGTAAVIMLLHIPDLLWDIRTGRKSFERVQREKMPKSLVNNAATVLTFLTPALVWYSLCRWQD